MKAWGGRRFVGKNREEILSVKPYRQLGIANTGSAKSMEKLSSGYRINRAGDDAAGLAISEKMRGQIRGLNQASRNAQDGISLIQTAEGALDETHAILQRMRELAVQSSTDTNTDADRANIQDEIDQLASEITRISETTQFNAMELLDGSFKEKVFHIGANANQKVDLSIGDMGAIKLGITEDFTNYSSTLGTGINVTGQGDIEKITITLGTAATSGGTSTDFEAKPSSGGSTIEVTLGTEWDADLTTPASVNTSTLNDVIDALKKHGLEVEVTKDFTGKLDDIITAAPAISSEKAEAVKDGAIRVNTQEKANGAITTINNALESVSKERSKLGAMQNRLEHTIKNLDTSAENLQASEARIRDVDMAKEMMEQTKQNILQQASTAMLAQANQAPQNVLQLLR